MNKASGGTVCRNCGETPTIRAHLIPQAFARDIREGGPDLKVGSIDETGCGLSKAGFFDDGILCARCDGRLTTNAGASDLARDAISFGRESRAGEDEDAISGLFTPEFRNRLDATIAFAGLSPEIVARVVEKFVMQLEAQLADRNVTIELSSAAKEWLAERGYDKLYGARPLARVIQEHIKKPLAEELLFGKLVGGGAVKVTLKDGKLEFEIVEAALPALPKPDEDGNGGADRRQEAVE